MAGGHRNENKHIGCMSGLLQIFDRQQMLAGKRVHSTKRLPPSTGVGGSPETVVSKSQTDSCQPSPAANVNGGRPISKSPVFARHSVDSKLATADSNGGSIIRQLKDTCTADDGGSLSECVSSNINTSVSVADGDDKQRLLRAPSVVARLMGLDSLSSSDQNKLPPPPAVNKPAAGDHQLQRSASSESRVPKYIDDNNFQLKTPSNNQLQKQQAIQNVDTPKIKKNLNCKTSPAWKKSSPRSFFDTTDFFPDRNRTKMAAMEVDFEKKMIRGRSMDDDDDDVRHSNDLSTLKQILEVLQLKGLLHNNTTTNNRPSETDDTRHDFVFNEESGIVLTKQPWRRLRPSSRSCQPPPVVVIRGGSRSASSSSPPPARVQSNLKKGRCNSIVKQKPLSIEIQTSRSDSSGSIDSIKENLTADYSPKQLTPKRPNKSPRNHNSPKQIMLTKNVVTGDKPDINAQNIVTPPSETLKGPKWDERIQGKSLLQRCDKLLHNIAEMNKKGAAESSSPPILPSPVSVLDSGFDKDGLASPLHNIEFKATSTDEFDEKSSLSISPTKLTEHEEFISDDSDFIYISQILGASKNLNEDSSIFSLIEKQLYNTSNVSKPHRKLVFDIIVEILDRNSELPPWKAASMSSMKHIWSEFQKIRKINIKASDVLVDLINGVLKKDLIEISEWDDHPIETSEAVLDVERMIFKDLVCAAISEVGEFSGKCRFLRSQRKLIF